MHLQEIKILDGIRISQKDFILYNMQLQKLHLF